MGRKRNQGKARRAAKAKAKEEAQQEERVNNNNPTAANDGQRQPPAAQLQRKRRRCTHPLHGAASGLPDIFLRFLDVFRREFNKYSVRDGVSIAYCLGFALDATKAEFAEVWNDAAKMKIAISVLLCNGTQDVLDGKHDDARDFAIIARFFEQYIAVRLKESQALIAWPKLEETHYADMHTLVKFFWRRIPCSCLDEKYEEVKSITKMGFCFRPQCLFFDIMTERSNTKYCSRCRNATYCSRKCQEADWLRHKPDCGKCAAMKAEFEAKQQNK